MHPAIKRDCEFIFRIAQNIFNMQISIIIVFVFHHRLNCAIYMKANIRNFIMIDAAWITQRNIDILFKIIQVNFSPSYTQNSTHSPKNQKTEFKSGWNSRYLQLKTEKRVKSTEIYIAFSSNFTRFWTYIWRYLQFQWIDFDAR